MKKPLLCRAMRTLEAMQWQNDAAHREAFLTWFGVDYLSRITDGELLDVPNYSVAARPGWWVVYDPEHEEFSTLTDEDFKQQYVLV